MLLLLRAPPSELIEASRIFFSHPNARVTRSNLLTNQRPKSLHEDYTLALLALRVSETHKIDCLIAEAILPYITNSASCCNANYHRCIAPRAFRSFEDFGLRRAPLFDEIFRLVPLRRQVEAFSARFHEAEGESHCNIPRGREISRLLQELTDDLKDLLSFVDANDRKTQFDNLGELVQDQVYEAKEAKETSVKVGHLSQLAYIFLPLQLTASAMGMNLRNFGTGNIELSTFILMLAVIAALSFSPMLYPQMSPIRKRISQIRAVTNYSKAVGFKYGWFCLFHQRHINDLLWTSGMARDISFFNGTATKREVPPDGVQSERRTSISAGLKIFPQYWRGVLDDIFAIIDTPQWGRKDRDLHTA